MLRRVLLSAADSTRVRRLVETSPLTRGVVRRFVAGERAGDAVAVARRLAEAGLRVSLDHLGENIGDRAGARANRDACLALLDDLADAGLATDADISIKLSSLGQVLGPGGFDLATGHAEEICAAASGLGATVTLDAEDHTTTDSTLSVLRELRAAHPTVGAVLQAYLRRTETDCAELATAGSRVRLCKGAYNEPSSVAFGRAGEVSRSYVRCLRALYAGGAYPMVATHDPTLIEIAAALAVRHGYGPGAHEFQMLYGVRPGEQRRLAADRHRVRVYVPYGAQWYPYLMRRVAERPANAVFFVRAALGSN